MVGIDAKNKCIIDARFMCGHCSLLVRDPVQFTACGHRVCQSCFDIKYNMVITCSQCKTTMPSHQMKTDKALKNEMQTLPIECSFCQWAGMLKNYQEHLDQFHLNPQCEYCGEQFDSVNKFNEHKVFQCEKITIGCLLKDFGCNQQIVRNEMKNHYLTEQHQTAILNAIHQLEPQLFDAHIDTGLVQTTTAADNNLLTVQLSIEETYDFLKEVMHNHDILNQELTSLKEKINDMKYVSYDGTFMWKITNVQEKMTDAESERQTSIYSPPFYSSPSGYKMRARLYLNGDGNARRTHMSLFFVLMRGLNDSILKFPFNYKVTFCLYDQTSTQRHIIDSFQPDIRSNSFQRPRSDMNIASGIPKFIPLTMIQQEGNSYVRENTMFIKVMVDFDDLPKTLLSYALSLNPGLPTYIQQTMIKQEAERKKRK